MTIRIKKCAWNPNVLQDAIYYLQLSTSKNDLKSTIKSWDEKTQPRFNAFLDRFEFTDHLAIVARFAKNNGFKIGGEEVGGIDTDIVALRIYLLLTCIDICVGKKGRVGKKFKDAVKNLSPTICKRFENHLSVSGKSTIGDIAECLYALRCGYTHSGFRFLYIDKSPFPQTQLSCDGNVLEIEKGFDLFSELKEAIAEIARKKFKLK